MKTSGCCTRPKYVCANDRMKLIGSIDGYFPDFGHHLENEMGGLWLYPIKLLDGFWMHFIDHTAQTVSCYMAADQFDNYPHKNEFYYRGGMGHTTVKAKRTQLAPEGINGIIVTYEFCNEGKKTNECTTSFLARTDLSPLWLAEEIGIMDGAIDEIEYDSRKGIFYAKDCDNPWHVAVGCSQKTNEIRTGQFFGPEITVGNGVSMEMTHHFALKPGESRTVHYYIAGSDVSRQEAKEHYDKLCLAKDYEQEKADKYQALYKQSDLSIGDASFEEIYRWVKVNTDWLVVDTSRYGRAIAAGIPEYPWWFGCDSFYTLQGTLCMGDYKLSRETLLLILEYSQRFNGNGRIVHEVLTNGHCPNLGNTQETAHFVTMIWKYYEWTGDYSLIEEAFAYITKSVEWLIEQDDDGDLFPSGYGIIEIAGLNMEMIDTAVYTYEAYDCYSKMCKCMQKSSKEYGQEYVQAALKYTDLAKKTKDAINILFWDEQEGLYCDAYTSYNVINEKRNIIVDQINKSKAPHMKAYVERLLEERKPDREKERGWLLNRNWVINTPMEIGISPRKQADRALEILHTSDYIGPYGMYLDGVKQDQTMTISTGVMAVAQVQYGYADRALELIERMFSSFSMATPGSISEMSPDYGCFSQAWTCYSVMLPIVRHFFGIQPSASKQKVVINPCLPSKWTKGSLKNVKVLEGKISIDYEKCDDKLVMHIDNHAGVPLEIRSGQSFMIDGVMISDVENGLVVGSTDHETVTVIFN